MNYFSTNSSALRLNEGPTAINKLRPGQIGALHALAAHFIARPEPAIISLPTGYGKTAVLSGACFVARAKRVLVVVPTSALRRQTVKAFKTFDTLRRVGALPSSATDLAPPIVASVEERITTEDAWTRLEGADVVVVTPPSASPEIEGIVPPPENFFDLVLVDEGHHSPARTWAAFIKITPNARHILCSATPFRKDRLQLPGKLIFYYSLKLASDEQAFGKVTYVPVPPPQPPLKAERDSALIQKAVEIFRRDQAAGFQHRLLIRTDKIADAEALAPRYAEAGLRVEAVSSRLSKGSIEAIEGRLIRGELDGVICVDMFGEGYDFPKFKIAVLHAAHRSLVPTLQFIGRFARTTDQETGDATFIGIPSDLKAESHELYRDNVDWDELLANVADARQQLALREREELQAFRQVALPSANYDAVDPSQFRLPQHIAAYRAAQAPNFQNIPQKIGAMQVTNYWVHEGGDAIIALANEASPPIWSRGHTIIDSNHDCFFIKYFQDTQILFVTATRRDARSYRELIENFCEGHASPLPYEVIRRILNGLQTPEFFSIGLRSTSPNPVAESYRILAGSQADRSIRDTDVTSFCPGHFFGRGESGVGVAEVIGGSSRGRMWSTGKISIPEILLWMEEIHTRISATALRIGLSGLDKLPYGKTLERIPDDTVCANWSRETFTDNPVAIWRSDERTKRTYLLDLEIRHIVVAEDGLSLSLSIGDDEFDRRVLHQPFQTPQYVMLGDGPELLVEARDEGRISIVDWFENSHLAFFTATLASFTGTTLNERGSAPFHLDNLNPVDWDRCEINVEFDHTSEDRITVQRYLRDQLLLLPNLKFILYDHRSGEAADFIVGQAEPDGCLRVTQYHCKAAGGQPSGGRTADVYELVGQIIKGTAFHKKDRIISHITRRTNATNANRSTFLHGTLDQTLDDLRNVNPIQCKWSVVAVQPGLSASNLTDRIKSIIASANDSLATQGSTLCWMVSP